MARIGDVRDALLLVHDQVIDDGELLAFGLQRKICRRVAVGARVVHMHVHITAHPAACRPVGPVARRQRRGHLHRGAGGDGDHPAHRHALGSLHDIDLHAPRRHLDGGGAGGVEVQGIEGMFIAVEIRRLDPRGGRGMEAPLGIGHRDARRGGRGGLVQYPQAQPPVGPQAPVLGHREGARGAPGEVQHAQVRVAVLVGDEGNVRAIGGPARLGFVPVPVGEREGLAALPGHQPQLQPVAPEIGAVEDAPAIGGVVRARAPVGLLVVQLGRGCPRHRRHFPESPGAVDAAAVGDVDDRLAVARPGGVDLVVIGTVVVPRQRALVLAGDAHHRAEAGRGQRAGEDVEALVEGRGDEHQLPPVRGEARLDVDRPAMGQLLALAAGKVQPPQLDGVVLVGGVDDRVPVGRPVRLVVVSGAIGQLHRHGGSHRLAPQRAAGRVHQFLRVRRPAEAARACRQLRQVHLMVVVGVRRIDDRDTGRDAPAPPPHRCPPRARPAGSSTGLGPGPRGGAALLDGLLQDGDGLVHFRPAHRQGRHEAHRALAAGQQQQAVVVGALDDAVAQLLAPGPCWPGRSPAPCRS